MGNSSAETNFFFYFSEFCLCDFVIWTVFQEIMECVMTVRE